MMPARLTLESNDRTLTLAFQVLAFLGFNPVYFFFLPPGEIHHTLYFSASYAAVAATTLVLFLGKYRSDYRKLQWISGFIVASTFGSLCVSYFAPQLWDFYIAFPPGFFTGLGIGVCACIAYRFMPKRTGYIQASKPNLMVAAQTYCERCKRLRDIRNPTITQDQDGQPIYSGYCSVCNAVLTRKV